MPSIERRNLLLLALPVLAASARANGNSGARANGNSGARANGNSGARADEKIGALPEVVPTGQDRELKTRSIGISSTTYKVLTKDTAGALFVMEQKNHAKGGPPRHIHHNEDELFFVLEGEYDVEVSGHRVSLKAGDCVLGPKGLPHAWAYVGNSTGRLLISFAPAGKMEAFFAASAARGTPGKYTAGTVSGDALMREFGLEHVGPPLEVG